MLQSGLIILSVVFIVAALIGTVLMWRNKGWFMQWLKGSFGFLLLFGALLCLLVINDLSSYKNVTRETPIATVRVFEMEPQEFDVTIATSDGKEQRYTIHGDQWQLDVRLLTWKGPFAGAGAVPLYRLDRLSGRYLSLEQERSDKRSVYSLADSRWLDLWEWLHKYSFWLDAQYGSAVFMPLTNGAVYSVNLTGKGMLARPINSVAEEALVQPW